MTAWSTKPCCFEQRLFFVMLSQPTGIWKEMFGTPPFPNASQENIIRSPCAVTRLHAAESALCLRHSSIACFSMDWRMESARLSCFVEHWCWKRSRCERSFSCAMSLLSADFFDGIFPKISAIRSRRFTPATTLSPSLSLFTARRASLHL